MSQSPPNEILQEIFNNFVNDICSLHSCLLVNKIWSINVVAILWNRPFHYISLSSQIISTYLSCLEKEKRLELDLKKKFRSLSFSSDSSNSPTYNYPSFLRHLSYFSFICSIQEWCIVHHNGNHSALIKIIQALFRLFAKFSSSLETLVFVMDMDDLMLFNENHQGYFGNFPSVNSSILREPIVCNWISHIKEIELAGDFVIDQNFPVLLTICKDLKKMEIRLPDFEYDKDGNHYDISVEFSSRFIELQRELKHFTLQESHYSKAIGAALMRQRSSLRHVEFIDTVFDRRFPLNWLPCCNQLEALTFIDSEMLIENILTPLQLSPLRHLKSLTFKEDPIPTNTLDTLIRSSNINLKEIIIGWPEDCSQDGHPNILNSISKFCPNLTKLGATIGRNEISKLFEILVNCSQLQSLEIYGNGSKLDVCEILPRLGENLPRTLVELDIQARWRFNADILHLFFDNAKNVPLYKFVIGIHDFINEEHLNVINESSLNYITFSDKKFPVTKEGLLDASNWLRQFIY